MISHAAQSAQVTQPIRPINNKHLKSSFEQLVQHDDKLSALLLRCVDDIYNDAPEWTSMVDELYHIFLTMEEGAMQSSLYDFLLYFASNRPKNYYPSGEEFVHVLAEYRIVTAEQHCYDIRELLKNAQIVEEKLIDPITQQPFHKLDQKRIFDHGQSCGITIDFLPSVHATDAPRVHAGFHVANYRVAHARVAVRNRGQDALWQEHRALEQRLARAAERVRRDLAPVA
jgi:hypothetical protein